MFHVDLFIDTSATSVGIRDVFVLNKMPPKKRLTNKIPIEEVYERDCITRLEQQVEVLTQQF